MKFALTFITFLFITASMLHSAVYPVPQQQTVTQDLNKTRTGKYKIAYTIDIPQKIYHDGTVKPAQTFNVIQVNPEHYLPNAIHIKTKKAHGIWDNKKGVYSTTVMSSLKDMDISSVTTPFSRFTSGDLLAVDEGLDRIYEVYYNDGIDPYDLCRQLMQNPEIEYATPIFKRYISDYTPNDPQLGSEWWLDKMQVKKAWDKTKGAKTILIAIVDSGVDINHEDLAANIWTNPKEIAGNGKDDDGNGKIDDVHGWDFVGNISQTQANYGQWQEDNDPVNISGFHGTHVAGLAAAVANNGKGISGVAPGCTILPVKCGSDQGGMAVYRGYDGIAYAAACGADIINCSWGGPGGSPAEQDVINYVIGKGCVVIVAAGNEGSFIDESPTYPASYDNIISVGSTGSSDRPSGFSDYGNTVSVFAPGENILSTMPSNNYGIEQGTSMACPIASGVAALIRSQHPTWTSKQIMHQLRSTSDPVVVSDTSLRPYFFGRVNAFKATDYNFTSGKNMPGMEVTDISYNSGTALTDYNEKILTFKIQNYIGSATNIRITLTALDNYLYIGSNTNTIESLTENEASTTQFSVKLLPNNPWYSGWTNVLVTFEAGAYKDYEIVKIPIKITSNNLYSTKLTFPSASYTPTWQGVKASANNNLWAVGTGGVYQYMSSAAGGYFKVINDNPSYGNISTTQACYSIYGFDANNAIAGSGPTDKTAKIYITANGGASWTAYDVKSITPFINDINFFDSNNGIILGDPINNKWGIGTTTNGGTSWTPVTNCPAPLASETGYVNSICWKGNYGWFGTSAGRVYSTTDRGKSWVAAYINNAVDVSLISFKDNLNGIAVYTEQKGTQNGPAVPRLIAYTTDGGNVWNAKRYDFSKVNLFPVALYTPDNSNTTYVLCSNGSVLSTISNGATFSPVLSQRHTYSSLGVGTMTTANKIRMWDLGTSVGYLDFSYVPSVIKKLLSVDDLTVSFDTVVVTKSNMKTLNINNNGNVDITINSIDIIPDNGMDTTEFKIFGTKPQTVPAGQSISVRIRFMPKDIGLRKAKFVINSDADSGKVININLYGYGKIINDVTEIVEMNGISLGQNVPNPSVLMTNIPVRLPVAKNIELNLINSIGQKINTVFKGRMDAGETSYQVSTYGLPSGVYYLQLNAEGIVLMRKFIVMN